MIYNDSRAWERNPILRQEIDIILQVEHNSTIKTQSRYRLAGRIEEYILATKDTLVANGFNLIISDSYTIPNNKYDLDGNKKVRIKDYQDYDGLAIVVKPPLCKGFLPGKLYGKKGASLGLTEPVPDEVYGKEENISLYTNEAPLPPIFKIVKQLDTQSNWPFLVLEAKSVNGNIGVCTNQAICDGALIVNSRFCLKRWVKGPSYEQPYGANLDNLCFSIVRGSNFSIICVHWYEKYQEGANVVHLFHTTVMGLFFTTSRGYQQDLRTAIENIWNWGLFKNYIEAEAVYREAVAKYRRNPDAKEFKDFVNAAGTDEASSVGEGGTD